MKRKTIIEVISALFILLFVYTATSKLFEMEKFKFVLKSFPVFGSWAGFIAYAVPITELAVSALLVIPRFRRVGLYASCGLMSFFTLYLGFMIAFFPKLPCSCGGVISQMTWTQHVIFNALFTGLSILAIRLERSTPIEYTTRVSPVV
jgi:putative oxidoreductase